MKVYKYAIAPQEVTVHQIPKDAEFLCAGPDPKGAPCLYFKVEPDAETEPRAFRIVGTGHDIPESLGYLVSLTMMGYHVFEVPAAHVGA